MRRKHHWPAIAPSEHKAKASFATLQGISVGLLRPESYGEDIALSEHEAKLHYIAVPAILPRLGPGEHTTTARLLSGHGAEA